MGIIRISNELQEEIEVWIEANGHKYTHPNMSAFANKALFEWLKKVKKDKNLD
jgi:hypothetical protein